MTSTSPILDHPPVAQSAPLLVSLPSLSPETMESILQKLAETFQGIDLIVASPEAPSRVLQNAPITVVGYTPAVPVSSSWTLTAADFFHAHELVVQHHAPAVLLLGAESETLEPEALRSLATSIWTEQSDLAVPRYALPPRAGLVNSAILYPVSRALFGAAPRFPLAIDLCMSARMAERMATSAQKCTAAGSPQSILWPVAEAAVAGFRIAQIDAGPRTLPQPPAPDLNAVLAQVTGSLFADVDAKAAFWQRTRIAQPSYSAAQAGASPATEDDIQPMLEAFRLAYGNLAEIWSLVLPPQSLLGLKRLSALTADNFVMPDSLWARIVYDFLLAYRLRTINRGHLLGALTPLYLAWVASHIVVTGGGKDPERHIESVAAAFEADRPYLVSRWRWPDRFNP